MIAQCFIHLAHPLSIRGNIIEAHLPNTQIGELCEIQRSLTDGAVIGFAQVIGFNRDRTILSLLNDNQGYSRSNLLLPTGKPFMLALSDNIKGVILDSMGKWRGRLDEKSCVALPEGQNCCVGGMPKDFTQRCAIAEPLVTGVRAIDGLLTCGVGQRIGIFAAAGSGKTSLMSMIIEHSEADVYIVALIGERGREVTEFVQTLRASSRCSDIVLVYATSDRSCVERCNAAQIATTVAEYFSAQGKRVLLFVDSITRYARALRDVALSLGELPARRGYPASVFEALPKLLERPGNFHTGSVTAFYTVLIESEDEPDTIGDEVRSILDGHIYLSKKLAAQGFYPAIDITQSISRVFQQVTEDKHQFAAARFRELLIRQRDMQLYLDLGEYRPGENKDNDEAMSKKNAMETYLKQDLNMKVAMRSALEDLHACVS